MCRYLSSQTKGEVHLPSLGVGSGQTQEKYKLPILNNNNYVVFREFYNEFEPQNVRNCKVVPHLIEAVGINLL